MAILRDYHCTNHGIFEAWEPNCPMKLCKGEISVVHLKPVGVNRRVIRGKQVWVATWRNDGIRTTEVYSIDKLGDAEALRLALRARREEMDFKARIHAAESRGINSLQLKAMRNFARKARREERRRLLALRL